MLQRTLSGFVLAALAIAAVVAPGCGGSDSTTTGAVAFFTPDTPTPGAATIALLPESSSGAEVRIRVTVTGVNSFFGAAFRIKYDTTALLFGAMDDSTSLLRTGVTDSDVLFIANSTSVPGEIIVSATRLNPSVAPPVDVTTTSDLVVVTFTARKAIAAGASDGRLEFIDPRQVCDGTTTPTGCGVIAVTWSGGGVTAQ
jgi:hypothetical protein